MDGFVGYLVEGFCLYKNRGCSLRLCLHSRTSSIVFVVKIIVSALSLLIREMSTSFVAAAAPT